MDRFVPTKIAEAFGLMVSFRFHIVSITAIFLAIAVGVVVGSTFVDRAIVDSLRSRIDSVSENLDRRRTDNARLEAEVGRYREFVDASAAFTVSTRLAETPVLVFAARGVDEGAVSEVVRLAEQAGAEVPGITWIETGWALDNEEATASLRELLGLGSGSAQSTRERALAAMTGELEARAEVPENGGDDVGDADQAPTTGPPAAVPEGQEPGEPPPTTTPPTTEPPRPSPAPVLNGLLDAGFLTFAPRTESSAALASLAGRGPAVLVVTGAEADPAVRGVLASFVESLVEANLVTAVGEVYEETGEDEDAPSRGELASEAVPEAVRERVAVVDHLDVAQGRVAVVLALSELRNGVVGRYGYGRGTDAVLPPWSPP